jgi:IS5 family transposase
VIEILYAQQKQMYEQGSKRVDDRIVSLHQPWVRPIVRGKAKAAVEFGAKIAVSLVDGYSRIEHLSWDNFHEGTTLQESVESYRADTGVYPERVLTDRAYRTRENLQYCKERGIRMSGPKLGRPPKDKALYRQQLLEERLESGERSAIESSFGVGKRRYSLNLVMERLQETSEVAIHVSILTMNLWKRLRALLFALFRRALRAPVWCRKLVIMSMVVVWGAEEDLKTVIVQ